MQLILFTKPQYRYVVTLLILVGLLWVFSFKTSSQSTTTVVEQAEIHPSNIVSELAFSESASLWDNRLIVGMFNRAYIYERDSSETWNEVALLTNPLNPTASTAFGVTVSIWGDTAVVGSQYDPTLGFRAGAVFIYERDALGNWNHVDTLYGSNQVSRDLFGYDVDIYENRIVISALWQDTGAVNAGAVYIFERDATGTWNEVDFLVPSDIAFEDAFGRVVSIWQDTVIVSSWNDDDLGNSSGSAYIFERDSLGNWNFVQKLLASDGAADDHFGWSVDLIDNVAVVGAANASFLGQSSGAAYVFERDSAGNWSETSRLIASDGAAGDAFGIAVGISGNRIVVGAEDVNWYADESSAAYYFEQDLSGNWTEIEKFAPLDFQADHNFGRSVSMFGDSVAIGAMFDNDIVYRGGSVYIFTFEEVELNPVFASTPLPNSTITLTGETGTTHFATLAISNIGDAGSLLDVAPVGTLTNFTVGTLPQDLSPTDGTFNIEISCVVPQASETLTLQTNETGNPIYSYKLECIANDPTPEVTPEITVEPTEEVTPEVTVEPTEEVTPEVTPEITAEPTEEVTPEVTVEPTEEVTPEVTVEPTEEVTPEVTPEVTAEPTEEVTPEATPESDIVTICHVAGLADDPPNYVILELPLEALNGHFDNNGTPLAGHEDDFLIVTDEDATRCAADTPEVTPEATAEAMNEPEVNINQNQSGNAPEISVFDPTISKIGFLLPGQVGVTGEQLEWIVTVSNTGNVVGQNVTVTDTLVDALRVDNVNAPGAVVNINGQTVTVTYPVLNVGETQQFSIITTVLQGVEVSNTACISAVNQTSPECATGNAITALPQTGENPVWRNWLWLLLIVPSAGLAFVRKTLQHR